MALLLAVPMPLYAAPPSDDSATEPDSVSRAVVEPTTAPSTGKALNAALVHLAKDPRNVDALIDAGNAAIALGDNEAALGFFSRADQVAPGNGRVKAAIAGARLHLDDPVEALRWYGEAQAAGVDPVTFALDRGLAYDLVGDNAAAVAQYRQVLASNPDAVTRSEALQREAISLAIGGDARAADVALMPLLQAQDRAAWRTHVFVLAIAGRGDDAVSVTRATMPADLAAAIGPYLRFMVQLTPAQQAAVASLGRFPRAADIGRDDPRVAAYAAAHPHARPVFAAAPVRVAVAPAEPVSARTRKRKGQAPAAPTTVLAVREPELVLPPPPPPPTALAVAAPVNGPPRAPLASRTVTPSHGYDLAQATGSATRSNPPVASVVPHPAVLSLLDMPPSSRAAAPGYAPRYAAPVAQAQQVPQAPQVSVPVVQSVPTATPVVQPLPTATPVVQPTPTYPAAIPPVVPLPAQPEAPIAPAAPLPTPELVPVPATSYAVVQPVPEAPPVAVIAAKAAEAKPEPAKPVHSEAIAKAVAPDKAAHTRADTKNKDKPADEKPKAVHGKGAKNEVAEVALVPCKSAESAKGRKAHAAASRHGKVAKGKSRHAGHDKADTADSQRCAPAPGNDRPDGPAGVSRDSDSDDNARPKTKAELRAEAKAKAKDKSNARDGDKAPEKPGKKVRYASRIWVEVLTGTDRDKMPGEWRALVRKAHKLKGHKPYLTPWHSNYRLLTGPFDSDSDAQDFIADLRKDGVSGFEWTSPAGQAIDGLALQ